MITLHTAVIFGVIPFFKFKLITYTTKKIVLMINNEYNYTTFYIIYKSLQFYDIVKMNTIKFIFRYGNNKLPFNS